MAIKSYKSTTNGRRGMTTLVNEDITTNKPEKSLLKTIKKNGGILVLENDNYKAGKVSQYYLIEL